MSTRTPYIPAECDQQGRANDGRRASCADPSACAMPICACRPEVAEASTDIGADMPGRRGPLPNSVLRWARVGLGFFIVCVFAAIGAGALYGFMTR